MAKNSRQLIPQLSIGEIADSYVRENFKRLVDYFRGNNQLEGFKFLSHTFLASGTIKIAHGLGFKPLDVVTTQNKGPGVITFNYDNFDAQYIEVSSTGQASFRAFVGTYWDSQ